MDDYILIPFAPEHFALMRGWFVSQAEVVQWGGPFLTYPLDDVQLADMLKLGERRPPARLCWMLAHNDRLVGHAQLGFDWRNGVALLSRVAVAPDARGFGHAVPMLRPVIAEAFGHSDIERVELNVFDWNKPAISAYLRLGFMAEGVRRSSAKVGDERWNTAIMGLLRSDWTNGRT